MPINERKNNDTRIWKWKKVDVLFVVGIGTFLYGVAIRDLSVMFAGAGIAGIPLAQRGDSK